MDQKSKKEQKKKMKWGKCLSFFPKVSTVKPAVDAEPSTSSSTRKRKRPSLRRVFRRMLSVLLPCMTSTEVEESISIQTPTHKRTDEVSRSSDPELHERAETHERDALRDEAEVESFISSDCSDSDQLRVNLEMRVNLDLLAKLQAAAILEDAAFDQMISDVDLDSALDTLDGMTEESSSLCQTETPSFIQSGSSQQQQATESELPSRVALDKFKKALSSAKIKQLGFPNLGNTCYMNSVLQCLFTAAPFRDSVLSQRERWNEETKMLNALTDLQMARLTGKNKKRKTMLLFKVKKCIESHYPDFLGDRQQDAHEFLIAFLSYLKEEGELLQSEWAEYTCPVSKMEFQLNRLRTCNSCGFQGSFREDCNYLSLVFTAERHLVDSLQQYFKKSSLECSCSRCPGTTDSETLELISLPRILVLQVMRFITPSMTKSKDRLEIPKEFSLSFSAESKEMTVIDRTRPIPQKKGKKKNRVEPEEIEEEVSDSSGTHYTLTGAVSHLGSSLDYGHYISHIQDFSGSGWLKCSDTSVKKSSWSKVSRTVGVNGYLLFYESRQKGAG